MTSKPNFKNTLLLNSTRIELNGEPQTEMNHNYLLRSYATRKLLFYFFCVFTHLKTGQLLPLGMHSAAGNRNLTSRAHMNWSFFSSHNKREDWLQGLAEDGSDSDHAVRDSDMQSLSSSG